MKINRSPANLLNRYRAFEGRTREEIDSAVARMKIQSPDQLRKISALELYWGFTHEGPVTLIEIGRRFGVSSARARQLCAGAERMLVHPSRWRD
jgi:DNA-directed RNA polymerase sigma subunit (sigma70/sigma32)